MRSWALIFSLFHRIHATKGPSYRCNYRFEKTTRPHAKTAEGNARLALSTAIPLRGGSINKGNIVSTIQRIISRENVSFATRPTTLVKATLRFVQGGQSEVVPEHCSQYCSDVEIVGTSLLNPLRVLKLTLFAFAVVEIADCITENDHFRSVYKHLVHEGWERADKWWSKGRREGGLFRTTTWNTLIDNPQSLIQAWNEQFSPKVQRAMGVTIGLILSPIMWSLAAKTLTLVSLTVMISEINLHVGEKIEIALQRVSITMSELWGRVDVALETIRRTFRSLLSKTLHSSQAGFPVNDLNKTAPVSEEGLPLSLLQGLAIGLLFGFLAGV